MPPKKIRHKSLSVISPILFQNMRLMYFSSLRLALINGEYRTGINARSTQTISIIPLAIATWESFLNESIFLLLTNGLLEERDRIRVLKLKLKEKTKELPKIFGKEFETSKNHFQDYCFLEDLRHLIVHFQFNLNKINYQIVDHLEKKHCTLPKYSKAAFVFPEHICSTESMRWAINVISEMTSEFVSFFPNERSIINLGLGNRSIEEREIDNVFRQLGIDRNSSQENYQIKRHGFKLF